MQTSSYSSSLFYCEKYSLLLTLSLISTLETFLLIFSIPCFESILTLAFTYKQLRGYVKFGYLLGTLKYSKQIVNKGLHNKKQVKTETIKRRTINIIKKTEAILSISISFKFNIFKL